MSLSTIQYVSDENGVHTAVIVPIELWREIESERETAYLLKSAKMKQRLLQAKNRDTGIPFEEACEKLGIRILACRYHY
ncbi:MAG: prevent-host-death protein [candidate division KSB1 bacterium]|nr:prevent-host-death protein [candidate division KSB1 bacterium]MDZ7301086.1 prevent-host-death protein [candidate division KSB1 bacterium]MDZ7312090.1 prevent-host-death protein [candidate division KSB1 bacterium]